MAVTPINDSSNTMPILLLKDLGNAEKTTHWIHQDCTTSSSCLFERIWFCLAAKYFQTTRSWMNIDLEQSRALLEKIRDRNQDLKDVLLIYIFNNAVVKFNTIAPRHLVTPVLPQPLIHFAETHIPPPVQQFAKDLLANPDRCPPSTIQAYAAEYVIKACLRQRSRPELTDIEYISDIIHRFEEKGGSVVILPALKKRTIKEPCLGILANDEISSVCHAGLVRSNVARLACLLVKLRQNVPLEKQNVRLTHGIRGGYDCQDLSKPMELDQSMAKQYGEAFGIVRAPRFGQEYARVLSEARHWWSDSKSPSMEDFFDQHYYSHQRDTSNRKVYLTFADTGLAVMQRLMSVNATDGDISLKGIIVVMIPDEDWISNYQMNTELSRLLYGLCLSQLMPKSDKTGLVATKLNENLVDEALIQRARKQTISRSPTIIGMQSLEEVSKKEIITEANPEEEGEWLLTNDLNDLSPQAHQEMQRFALEVIREIHQIPQLSDNILNVAYRHLYRLALRRYTSLFQPLVL